MDNLNIRKSKYIKVLKNRGISKKRSASKHEILELINNLTKKDLIYLLKLRNIKINDDHDSNKSIVNALLKDAHTKKLITVHQQLHKKNVNQEIVSYAGELKRQRTINKAHRKKLQQEIYGNIQKRKQDKINNELKKLRLNELANRNNITQADSEKIKQFNNLNLKTLQKLAQQRNINTTGLKKKNLIYPLIRSEKNHKENNYFEYITKDTNNEIHNEINEIRKQLVNVTPYLEKKRVNSN